MSEKVGKIMNKTMSIYAEALISNRGYKNARVNGDAVGVDNARVWSAQVKSCLVPAYDIFAYRYNHMGEAKFVAPCDMSALYDAIRPIVKLIGEVNGDWLNSENVAEIFVAKSVRTRAIDTSNEMAHARCDLKSAQEKHDKFEQGNLSDEEYADKLSALKKSVDDCKAEVKRLESLPGNCKRINDMQSYTAFIKEVEMALGDAITKQSMRSSADVIAEREAREQARKDKRKANKLSKKSAK